MTADIELLPLPDRHIVGQPCYFGSQMQDYARANVEHYVKELQEEVARARGLWGDAETLCHKLYDQNAAKDAEIERLRAAVEAVEAVWAAMPRDARYLDPPDGGCVPLHEQVRRMAADATRAERLAEALRELVVDMERAQANMRNAAKTDPRWEGCAEAIQPRVDAARAALHEHEHEYEQEVG